MIKEFVKNESGMETIEFVVVLAIVAGLIAIVTRVGTAITSKGNGAEEAITNGISGLADG